MRVPFLRPGESGEYDYEADRKAKNFLNLGSHFIQPQQSPREEDELGVMGKYQTDAIKAEQKRQLLLNDPEYRANKQRQLIFGQAIMMDASVTIREENEKNDLELEKLSGPELGTMVERKKDFLDTLKRHMEREIISPDLSEQFGRMFDAYSQQELAAASAWRNNLIKEYAIVAGKEQRDAFADMATKPHVLFDDAYQMGMRNLLQLNVEKTYGHLPEEELAKKRDEANAELYERIFAKRLEVDPESAKRFISDPVVRRVFVPDRLTEFGLKSYQATRELTCEATGLAWADEGIDPEEAKRRAAELWKGKAHRDGERQEVLQRYADFTHARNVARVRSNAESLHSALRESHNAGFDPDSIPSSVRLGDPDLHGILKKDRAIRKKNGGGYPEPDYAYFLKVLGDFDPDAAARIFSDRWMYGEAVLRLGGPDSALVATFDAMIQEKATPEMRRELDDLVYAAKYATRLKERQPSSDMPGDADFLNTFVSKYSAWKRIYLSRNNLSELAPDEQAELAKKTAEEMGLDNENAPDEPDGVEAARKAALGYFEPFDNGAQLANDMPVDEFRMAIDKGIGKHMERFGAAPNADQALIIARDSARELLTGRPARMKGMEYTDDQRAAVGHVNDLLQQGDFDNLSQVGARIYLKTFDRLSAQYLKRHASIPDDEVGKLARMAYMRSGFGRIFDPRGEPPLSTGVAPMDGEYIFDKTGDKDGITTFTSRDNAITLTRSVAGKGVTSANFENNAGETWTLQADAVRNEAYIGKNGVIREVAASDFELPDGRKVRKGDIILAKIDASKYFGFTPGMYAGREPAAVGEAKKAGRTVIAYTGAGDDFWEVTGAGNERYIVQSDNTTHDIRDASSGEFAHWQHKKDMARDIMSAAGLEPGYRSLKAGENWLAVQANVSPAKGATPLIQMMAAAHKADIERVDILPKESAKISELIGDIHEIGRMDADALLFNRGPSMANLLIDSLIDDDKALGESLKQGIAGGVDSDMIRMAAAMEGVTDHEMAMTLDDKTKREEILAKLAESDLEGLSARLLDPEHIESSVRNMADCINAELVNLGHRSFARHEIDAMVKGALGYFSITSQKGQIAWNELTLDHLRRIQAQLPDIGGDQARLSELIASEQTVLSDDQKYILQDAVYSGADLDQVLEQLVAENQTRIADAKNQLTIARNNYDLARVETGNPLLDRVASNFIRELPFTIVKAAAMHALKVKYGAKAAIDATLYLAGFMREVRANYDAGMSLGEATAKAAVNIGISVTLKQSVKIMTKDMGMEKGLTKAMVDGIGGSSITGIFR